MRNKFIVVVSILQLILVLVLVRNFLGKRQEEKVLGAVNIAPINKENLVFPTDSEFKYYYELEPNKQVDEKLFWTENEYAHYTYNQDGLNERFDYHIVKPPNTFRIITLGDSFTYGHFVDTQFNWTEVLEDMLKNDHLCKNFEKFEVINLGMHGYDVPYIVKRFFDHGPKYSPDMIIWFESGSGYDRYNEMYQPYIQKCNLEKTKDAENYGDPTKGYDCWAEAQETFNNQNGDYIQEQIEKWIKVFSDMKGNTPTIYATFNHNYEEIKKTFSDRIQNIPNMIFMDDISNIYDVGGFFPDMHPNIKGHQVIAEDIFKYLEENKFLISNCEE